MRLPFRVLNWFVVVGLLMGMLAPVIAFSTLPTPASAEEVAVELDGDVDGVADNLDNCPEVFNPGQEDGDLNGVGDACEPQPTAEVNDAALIPSDIDGDGYTDDVDNCSDIANPGQEDWDGNGVGDACDVPATGTIVITTYDSTPGEQNSPIAGSCFQVQGPEGELISCDGADGADDGIVVLSDLPAGFYSMYHMVPPEGYEPLVLDFATANLEPGATVEVTSEVRQLDSDGDGHADSNDNCPYISNPGQENSNETPEGDACEPVPLADTDNDGLSDDEEAALGTDPQNPDTDSDGVDDYQETHVWGTDPLLQDTDGDGLTDFLEIDRHGTNPLNPDTDGDFMSDGNEVANGFDPLNPDSHGSLETPPAETPPPTLVPENTQPGTDVEISGLGDGRVSVTFAEVTQAGDTTADISYYPGPADMPEGYSYLGAFVYAIDTTAAYSAPVTVCINYAPNQFTDPGTIQLFHDDGSGWQQITTSNSSNGETGIVCGVTKSLSPFLVAEETPTGSLRIVAEDWYGNPAPSATLLVYQYNCGYGTPIAVTADDNGTAVLPELSLGSWCVTDALGIHAAFAYVEFGQQVEVIAITGEQPEWGHIELVLQDENGNPLTPDQISSNACVNGSSSEGGAAEACDSADGLVDGKLHFSGMPRTVITLAGYVAPYGFEVIDLPATISGFIPGETVQIGLPHRSANSPSASLIVNVVDAAGAPLPGACFKVAALEGVSGCDTIDGSNDGSVFIYGPFAPGDYEIEAFVSYRSGGLYAIATQTVTIQEVETLVYATVVMQPSLIISATDGTNAMIGTCFKVTGESFDQEVCDWRDGDDGIATVYGLPEGEYVVELLNPVIGYVSPFDYTTVLVGSGIPTILDAVFIPRTDTMLTVTVLDENRVPVPGSCVEAQGESSYEQGCTDANGVIQFYETIGEVNVRIYDPARGHAEPEPVAINVENQSELTLESHTLPESVVVQVVDPAGVPIRDACVYISSFDYGDQDCSSWDSAPENGVASLYNVPPGTYTMSVWNDSWTFEMYTADVTVTDGELLELEVTLVPIPTNVSYSLASIRSMDGSGNLLPGACYTLLFPGRGVWYACDAADGANDGITQFGNGYETYFNGEYTLIQSKAPEGVTGAAIQTFTIGTDRPVSVTVLHGWALETEAGTDVVVQPSGNTGVALTFDNVVAGGTTTVQPVTVEEVPQISPEFSLDGAVFFEISTTATFDGAVAVCLSYNPADFDRPQDLALLHYENGAWTDVTVSNDSVAGIICGSVSSFSPFALVKKAEAPNSAPVLGSVTRIPTGQVATGTAVNISATFTDVDTDDTHSAVIDWGDGTQTTGSVTESAGAGTVTGTYTYTTPGLYHVTVTVMDDEGAAGTNSVAATIDVPASKPAKPPKSGPKPPKK